MSTSEDIKRLITNPPNAIIRLIVINVLIFLAMSVIGVFQFFMQTELGILPFIKKYFSFPSSAESFIFRPWSIITYMFLHNGIFHILFNMLWLYWMGKIMMEYLGVKRVVGVYFLGGIFGALLYMAAYNLFPVYKSVVAGSTVVGASAGVMAVVAATATQLPDYSIRLLLFGDVKLKWLAIVIVIIDFISIQGSNSGGSIAHLGGAFFGFLFIKQLQKGSDLSGYIDWIENLFKPKQPLKVSYRNPEIKKNTNNQKTIDAILDKISESGYDSLSKEEKEILFKASKDDK